MDGSNFTGEQPLSAASAELRQFIERIERLREEQAEVKAQEKEVFAELKGRGYLARPIRTLLKERAQDPDQRAEEQALLDLYKSHLGMS